MKFRSLILGGALFLYGGLWAQSQTKIPHELTDFYKNLQDRFSTLEAGLGSTEKETSLADKFLGTLVKQQIEFSSKQRSKPTELVLTKELRAKIESLIKKNPEPTITVELLDSVLKKFPTEFSLEEKLKLAALLLVHEEKQLIGTSDQEKGIESLVKKYLKDPFFAEEQKSNKKGLDLLTDLISKSLVHPESLDTLLNPVKEQIFDSEKSKLSNLSPLTPIPTFNEAIKNLQNLQESSEAPGSNSNSISLGNHPIPSSNGGGKLAPRSCAMGGSGGVPMDNVTPTPDVQDTPELKACVNEIRKKRFNVELGLPGALCASTPIAKDPAATKKGFSKNLNGTCEVDLASATHCAEGAGNLAGRMITAHIGGANVPTRILRIGTVDPSSGPSVQNGNPDLLAITAEIPCSEATKLEIARIPSPEEVKELARQDSIPLVLQQNATINASQQGSNQATIAGTGAFEKDSNDGLRNYLRFNTKSQFNSSSGLDLGRLSHSPGFVLDSNRIKSGDSGGAALTCKFDENKNVKDTIFLGAISHITVRGDVDEGKEGGIASGQSLLNLSRRAWGDERLAQSRASNLERNNASALQSVLTNRADHN